MKSRERFLSLLRHDIPKLDLAERNFGVYRILDVIHDSFGVRIASLPATAGKVLAASKAKQAQNAKRLAQNH